MVLLKVGDVAKKTGLTVRALHHYDEIGLLTPEYRSQAGYRCYTPADLMQLQRIKSLQQLGFALEDIREVLKRDELALLEIIAQHLQSLTLQLQQQQMLVQRLNRIRKNLTEV